jgi:hypothetical protein
VTLLGSRDFSQCLALSFRENGKSRVQLESKGNIRALGF